MTTPKHKLLQAFVTVLAGSTVLTASTARAGLLVNIFDDFSSGVALKITVQGRLDTLPTPLTPPYPDYFSCGVDGLLSMTSICTGPDNTENLNLYPATSNIAEIPLGIMGLANADSVSGQTFALMTANNPFPHDASGIIFTYVVGTPFFSSATFAGESLNSIGLAQGLVGVWSLTGTPEQIIVFAGPVPGPLPLLGAASAFGFSRRLRKRIQTRPNR